MKKLSNWDPNQPITIDEDFLDMMSRRSNDKAYVLPGVKKMTKVLGKAFLDKVNAIKGKHKLTIIPFEDLDYDENGDWEENYLYIQEDDDEVIVGEEKSGVSDWVVEILNLLFPEGWEEPKKHILCFKADPDKRTSINNMFKLMACADEIVVGDGLIKPAKNRWTWINSEDEG